ncbi:site-specific integrase [Pantoea sp. SS70]|uniref:tyrosine-type recombinase/integrase n=1 Tax=Pantoea sp. SS70 TaxID=3024247 RepID=UPI002452B482|nr:site-specific integrase [Pantoea sp. SS70]WGK57176.1 site-specific integrase [Pantoea sp. SS70]
MSDGERYCLIVNKGDDMPLYYPNLFITSVLRKKRVSVSTVEIASSNIIALMRFLNRNKIDLEERISTGQYFTLVEIEDLVEVLRRNLSDLKKKKKLLPIDNHVAKGTFGYRIHTICTYLKWLCDIIHKANGINDKRKVNSFIDNIKANKPNPKSYKNFKAKEKTLNDEQIFTLFNLLEIDNNENPFSSDVRLRNRLVFLLLYHLGIRAGELLNLKIIDFDFVKKIVTIKRRHDDKSDIRKIQPLVKTLSREIPLKEELIDAVYDYVFNDREEHAKNKIHDYLLVTHGNGKNKGEPLTVHAYEKIISTIKDKNFILNNLSGHMLRHSWNYAFSRSVSKDKLKTCSEDKLRNYLMGWSDNSKMCEVYNRKFLVETEKEVIKSLYDYRNRILAGK